MARGFESKSVADQQETAQAEPAGPRQGARPRAAARRKQLELSRADVQHRLEHAQAAGHREILLRALEALDAEISRSAEPVTAAAALAFLLLAAAAAASRRSAARARGPRRRLHDRRAARRRREDARRTRAHHLAQSVERRVSELWLHLYLNAFRNNESTFMRESGGQLRSDRMPDGGWGWTDVTSIRRADGVDLLPSLRYEHPDDDNARDRTVVRVTLPEPVAPGGAVALDVAWKATLPRVFARTGYAGDYFLVGQWFPKLGVYEPAGLRGRAQGGWNCHQFHANSEFYADFGHYRVAITLPERFVVGATGRAPLAAVEPRRHGHARVRAGRRDRLRVDRVAALRRGAPDVLGARRRHAGRVRRGGPPARPAARGAAPGRRRGRACCCSRSTSRSSSGTSRRPRPRSAGSACGTGATRTGRSRSSTPRYGAGGSGGMEYPTFITAGTTLALQPLAVRPRAGAGGGRRPRVRPPVLAGHGGDERVRGVLARRGPRQLLDGKGHGAGVRAVARPRRRPAPGRARARAPRERREPRVRPHPDPLLGVLSRQLRVQLLQPHRADAAHARGPCRPRDRCARVCARTTSAGASGTRGATTSSRRPGSSRGARTSRRRSRARASSTTSWRGAIDVRAPARAGGAPRRSAPVRGAAVALDGALAAARRGSGLPVELELATTAAGRRRSCARPTPAPWRGRWRQLERSGASGSSPRRWTRTTGWCST